MSEPAPETGGVVDQGFGYLNQDQSQQQQQPPQDEIKINPAWNNLLSRVPEGLHQQILPELKQWDQNYQQGISKVHSQYEAYKPFLEQQIDPNALNEAYMLREALEQDPMKFVQALVEHYKLELPTEQGQPEEPEEENLYDVTQHPEFQRMKQMVELMGQHTLTSAQQAQAAQEDADLDQMISAAAQKHGDNFDEEWILQHLMVSGVETVTPEILDQAVQNYQEHVQKIVQNYRSPSQNAPVIMGGGGGVPSQNIPIGQMDGNQRRALVVQTLKNLNANSG